MTNIQQYLRVRLAHDWYGIDVSSVVEVLHLLALNELPASRPDVLGLMRLREMVIPVLDLRLYSGLSATYTLTTPIIVANSSSGTIGLVVDEVDDLARVEASQISFQDVNASRYVSGVARLPNALLLLLDVSRLRDEIQLA